MAIDYTLKPRKVGRLSDAFVCLLRFELEDYDRDFEGLLKNLENYLKNNLDVFFRNDKDVKITLECYLKRVADNIDSLSFNVASPNSGCKEADFLYFMRAVKKVCDSI